MTTDDRPAVDYVARIVAAAPPLSDRLRARLAVLLWPAVEPPVVRDLVAEKAKRQPRRAA